MVPLHDPTSWYACSRNVLEKVNERSPPAWPSGSAMGDRFAFHEGQVVFPLSS